MSLLVQSILKQGLLKYKTYKISKISLTVHCALVPWKTFMSDSLAILCDNIYCVDSDMTCCRIKILTLMNVLKGLQEFFETAKYLKI